MKMLLNAPAVKTGRLALLHPVARAKLMNDDRQDMSPRRKQGTVVKLS